MVADEEQIIKKIWDKAYLESDEKDKKIVWRRIDRILSRQVLQLLDPNDRVLEAGCGISAIMGTLMSEKADVVGIDISSIALKRAHKLFGKPTLIQADICYLPLRDHAFDLIYNVGVIEHFVNPKQPLKEIVRVLKPLGTVMTAVPNKFSLWSLGRIFLNLLNQLHISKPWKYGYERPYTKYELRNLLAPVGFEKLEVLGVGIFEALYITIYFSLNKPKVLLQLLDGLLLNKIDSVWAKILKHFAEAVEKIDVFGLYVVAYGRVQKLENSVQTATT
jgi:ubiquinone/menaquinone biosynthesis C-methylase UbiE